MTFSLSLQIGREILYRLRFPLGIVEISNERGRTEIILFKKLRLKVKPPTKGVGLRTPYFSPHNFLSIKSIRIVPRGDPKDPFIAGILHPFFPQISFYGEDLSLSIYLQLKISLLRFIKIYYNNTIRRK